MVLSGLAMAAAMLAAPEAPGSWRIVEESSAASVAIQYGKRTPAPGAYGTVYILKTWAEPRVRNDGFSYRQTWTELSITCPGEGERGRYSDVWQLIAHPDEPLPRDMPVPPVAVRSLDDDYFGPFATALCNGAFDDGPIVEGNWATVLSALLARSDAVAAGEP